MKSASFCAWFILLLVCKNNIPSFPFWKLLLKFSMTTLQCWVRALDCGSRGFFYMEILLFEHCVGNLPAAGRRAVAGPKLL
jgi:hypothetical protein